MRVVRPRSAAGMAPARPQALALPAVTLPAVAAADPLAVQDGKGFAIKRIRHAVELAGSCFLIALFVVLVLFG